MWQILVYFAEFLQTKKNKKKSRYDDHENKIRLNSFTGNHLLGL
jgi:hypothetical protein